MLKELLETSVGQPITGLSHDLPPGFGGPESFGPRHLYMGPSSGRDTWTGPVERDMCSRHHRRSPPRPT